VELVLSTASLKLLSRCPSAIVTGFSISVRKNVAMGGVAFIPVNAIISDIFPRCGDGEFLSTLCTTGNKSAHSSKCICISETKERKTRKLLAQALDYAFTPCSIGQCKMIWDL